MKFTLFFLMRLLILFEILKCLQFLVATIKNIIMWVCWKDSELRTLLHSCQRPGTRVLID